MFSVRHELVVSVFFLATGPAVAQPTEVYVCQLQRAGDGFDLHCPDDIIKGRLTVPAEYLTALDSDGDEVNSILEFDKDVSAYRISSQNIGIHMSSFEIQDEGSLQAAAGTDIFLNYNLTSHEFREASFELGVTKSRFLNQGCWTALNHRFFLADVNMDGVLDIGIQREELKCNEWFDANEEVDRIAGPYFCSEEIQWHVFDAGNWSAESFAAVELSAEKTELPLLGIDKSPIDYALQFATSVPCCDQALIK